MADSYDHDLPPVTCNNLDNYQRARLVRSTRKIGAVLGTTPHLVEADACVFPSTKSDTKSSRRHGSIFHLFPEMTESHSDLTSSSKSVYSTSSTNSSSASLAQPESRPCIDVIPAPHASKGRRSGQKPAPLMLRVNAVPVAPTDTRIPLSPLAPPGLSPTYPEETVPPSASELRRRRMAKLSRTLGETVPTEIVFPQTHSDEAAPYVIPSSQLPPRRSSKVWATGGRNGSWVGEWNRTDIREVQDNLRSLKVR